MMKFSDLGFCQISPGDFRNRGPIRCAWQECPARLVLPQEGVHLWLVDLERKGWHKDVSQDVLSDDEKGRASRFRFERDRSRYCARHVLLRQIIGAYLQRTPREIEFSQNAFGKPELADASGDDALQFNLSNSATWTMYSFTRRGKTGIDLETIRQDFGWEEIVNRFFHAREARWIGASSGSHRTEAFFTCWTLKEAFVKASGIGLQRPLREFDFSPVMRGRKEFTDADNSKWLCATLRPGDALVAGLVVEG